MELTLPGARARRDVPGEALVCAAEPQLRLRLCQSVLWLTSWSTVSVASPEEALAAFRRRAYAALLVELREPYIGVLGPALAWEQWAERERPFVIGVACEAEQPCAVPSGWLDARLGPNYGPRAFGDLFREPEPMLEPGPFAALAAAVAPGLRLVR